VVDVDAVVTNAQGGEPIAQSGQVLVLRRTRAYPPMMGSSLRMAARRTLANRPEPKVRPWACETRSRSVQETARSGNPAAVSRANQREARLLRGVASMVMNEKDSAPERRGDDSADDGWFPESVAEDYDAPGGANAPDVVEPAVQVLADMASGGPVLEFAVGTGRIAAPLAARGVRVKGIELSRAMAARITNKPGGEAVEVTIGDITSTRVTGQFSLVYLVFNTISNVTTQDGQVAVFCNAAAHLRPGGLFLIEVGLPDLRRLPPGQDTVPFTVAPRLEGGGYVGFDQYDVVTQQFTSNHITVSADGSGRFRRIPFRYAWPAEMDLMARIAGMKLRHRWSDWDRSDLTQESTKHISVWAKA
jgi:SAM-dependent methyltransferase